MHCRQKRQTGSSNHDGNDDLDLTKQIQALQLSTYSPSSPGFVRRARDYSSTISGWTDPALRSTNTSCRPVQSYTRALPLVPDKDRAADLPHAYTQCRRDTLSLLQLTAQWSPGARRNSPSLDLCHQNKHR